MKKKNKNKISKLLVKLEFLKLLLNIKKYLKKQEKEGEDYKYGFFIEKSTSELEPIVELVEIPKDEDYLNKFIQKSIEEVSITEEQLYSEPEKVKEEVITKVVDEGGCIISSEVHTEVYSFICEEFYCREIISEPYYDLKESYKLWEIVKKAREENKNNSNYPHIHSLSFKDGKFFVYLKIGEYENKNTPLIEAYLKNKDNSLFMNEFKYLFKITCEDSEITIDMVLNTAKLKYKEMYGVNVEVQTNEDDNYSFSEYTFVDDNNKHKKKNKV